MAASNNVTQFSNQAQDISRSMFGAFQGIAEVQSNILQKLSGTQQALIQQSYEAANDQLQVMSKVHDPREFAAAQADLVKTHGQRYVETVKQAIDVSADAWQEYGNKVESTTRDVNNKTERAVSSKKDA
ncbi:MAG: phasin family protein [Gammaproteobacteria bacterium]|nr:phasin family protein [Gammaproteobacteria bacterium]